MSKVKFALDGILVDKKFFYKIIFLLFFCWPIFIFAEREDAELGNIINLPVPESENTSLPENLSEILENTPTPKNMPEFSLEPTSELSPTPSPKLDPTPSATPLSEVNPTPSPVLNPASSPSQLLFSPSPSPSSAPTPSSSPLPLPKEKGRLKLEDNKDGTIEEEMKLVISEVMYYFKNQEGKNDEKGQWIEFFNNGKKEIEVEHIGKYGNRFKYNLRICDRWDEKKEECKKDYQVYYEKEELKIDGEEIFIIARNKSIFENNYPEYEGKILESSFNLSSTLMPNFLGLFTEKEEDVWFDNLNYYSDWGGKGNNKTIERKNYDEKNDEENWTESFSVGGTPGKKYEKIEISYPDEIYINEILPNPEGSDAEGEFIELLNLSKEDINLSGWKIKDKTGKEYVFNTDKKIEAGGFLVIFYKESNVSLNNNDEEIYLLNPNNKEVDKIFYNQSEENFSYARKQNGEYERTDIITPGKENIFPALPEPIEYSKRIIINELLPNPSGDDKENEWIELYNLDDEDINLAGWFLQDESNKKFYFEEEEIKEKDYFLIRSGRSKISLNNGQDSLNLFDPNQELVSRILYDNLPGENYTYARKNNGDYSWTNILTPEKENQFLEDRIFPSGIYFNEIFSNAEGADKNNEWIEFFNGGVKDIDLSDWIIENSSGKKMIISDFKITGRDYAVFYFKNTTFTIKNSGEKLILRNPKGELVDEVSLKESAPVNSSFNKTVGNQWRWSRFLTPGRKNQLNNSPQISIKKSRKIYQDMVAYFDASKTFDSDRDGLKFKWDFGDGHKSYKKETSHIYRKIGDYQVKLSVNDGSEEVVKDFSIEVRKFPHYKIKIIEFMPNPKGRDTEGEYVILKNYSRHRINLDGWKIATGKDKKSLTNHLINKKLIIEPGKTRKVKRKYCALALLNSKGVVALKYPNDDLADLVNYEKDKIAEDERCFIGENNDWNWQSIELSEGNEKKEAMVDINSGQLSDLFWEGEDMEEVEVLGESFKDLISEIFHNERMLISENLSKIKFDNWRDENKRWLELGGLILFLGEV